jgi:hypothetical protein
MIVASEPVQCAFAVFWKPKNPASSVAPPNKRSVVFMRVSLEKLAQIIETLFYSANHGNYKGESQEMNPKVLLQRLANAIGRPDPEDVKRQIVEGAF